MSQVGLLNLDVGRAGLAEFLSLVSILEVPPHTSELGWDVKVTVLFGSNLDDVQFGKQVAVCQGEVVAIQKLPLGDGDVFSRVDVNLLREWGV